MIYSAYNSSKNNSIIFYISKIHNTIIFTNKDQNNNKKINYIATKIKNIWKKIINIFEVAWRNISYDKKNFDRRRIYRRNKSCSNKLK